MLATRIVIRSTLTLGLAGASLAACGDNDQPATGRGTSTPPTVARDTGMPMSTMPARAAGSGAMVDQMRVHLQAMRAMTADSLRAALPLHREMVDAMLPQMTREIMEMNVPANPRWQALMDSVHRDLDVMRGLTGVALDRAMAAHRVRLTELLDLHDSVMASRASRR